jgi:putative acetyltransferase
VSITLEKPCTAEVHELLSERDDYFDRLYARKKGSGRPAKLEAHDTGFFCARVAGQLIGCGALIRHPDYGELKRFYVREAFRGKGLGRKLLDAVVQHAHGLGCRVLRLETGVRQPAAIALYRSAGFCEAARFGDYNADPLSVFMEKVL